MLDIIIPIKNSKSSLSETLTELLPQLEDGDRVIIGDYGSIDGLNVDFFPDNEKILYLKSLLTTETKIINEAIKYYCNNQYVMILDPRCAPMPDFLMKIKTELKEDLVILCKVDRMDGQGKICKIDKRFLKDKAISAMCRMDCFCFPRRKALDIGLFNERFTANNSYTHGILFCEHLKEYAECNIHGITQFPCVYYRRLIRRKMKEQAVYNYIKNEKPQVEYKHASIIIPSDDLDSVRHLLNEKDEIISFNTGTFTICTKIYKAIKNSKHDLIILLNPEGKHYLCNTIEFFKDFYEPRKHPFLISNPSNIYYIIYENMIEKADYRQIDNFTSICFSKDTLQKIDSSLHTKLVDVMKGMASNRKIEMIKGIITGKKGRGKIAIIENAPYTNIPSIEKILPIDRVPIIGKLKKRISGKLEIVSSNKNVCKNRSYSFLIPYMHEKGRFILLKKCLEKLKKLEIISKDNIQICIHEVGYRRGLDDDFVKDYTYLYTKFKGLFNRAWVINRGIREMATGEILILMDGDLITNAGWLKEIFNCNYPAVAWGTIFFLNKNNTKKYIDTGQIDTQNYRKRRVPNILGAAGGATFIPRKIFFDLKGIPEVFAGWGGEDNIFLSKLNAYGYPTMKFRSTLYHLFHSHRTKGGDRNIVKKCQYIFKWNKQQWMEYNERIGDNWGKQEWKKISI